MESSLAILREKIVEADAVLKLALADSTEAVVSEASNSRIPVIGQAVLGFVLPWILAMVAIPLEMLLDSGRHVVAALAAGLLSRLRKPRPGDLPRDPLGLPDAAQPLRRLHQHSAAHRTVDPRPGRGRARPAPPRSGRRGGGRRRAAEGWRDARREVDSGAAIALAGLLALLAGCGEGRRYDQAICVLIDVSGTYADQKQEVVKVIKRDVLPGMVPGDTFIAILVDSESYEKDNVKALTTLDARPSRANAQKLALARQLDAFAASDERSEYTDIPGAMMLGAEYLQEVASGSRVMLVFSDLQEELPSGTRSADAGGRVRRTSRWWP